jgi:hypothetical protein
MGSAAMTDTQAFPQVTEGFAPFSLVLTLVRLLALRVSSLRCRNVVGFLGYC